MKISKIFIRDFKRFTKLTVQNIPSTAKVVLVVGPNGSGKSSLFDAFLHWYRYKYQSSFTQGDYYAKGTTTIPNHSQAIQIEFHDWKMPVKNTELKGKFYFRTAYRNDPDFTVSNLSRLDDPASTIRLTYFIQNDSIVHENYSRLVSKTVSDLYNENNDQKNVLELRTELTGKIRSSLQNIFDELILSSIGDPLIDGTFYFEKGITKRYHYKNLSGGEKAAFDLILDIILKTDYYPDAIYCIDEPEAHMHTKLQSRLFSELFNLVPDNGQLWLATHSLGMLKMAREIEREKPGSIVFLNFDGVDFDSEVVLDPSKIDRTIWEKFVEITLGDFSSLVAPAKIIFCEGEREGIKYKNFDAQVFNRIFNQKYPDVAFISLGSANEIEKKENATISVVQEISKGSEIIKVVDRDSKNTEEVKELNQNGIKVLTKRHIECYLLDDEIIKILCRTTQNEDKIESALKIKADAVQSSIIRGNPADDIKSASGEIFTGLKKLLNLNNHGNTAVAFMRDVLAPLITENTEVFKLLEKDIFG